MTFYARPSWRLFWQVAADLFVLGWVAAWWFVGRAADAVVRAIAEPARQAARMGDEVERQLTDAATQAGGVPVVGDGLRRPFDDLAGSVEAMAGYAQQQVTSIEQAATLIGWLVFAIPALLLVALWLPRRLAFAAGARETLELVSTADGSQLLALRALATQPLSMLRTVAPDPVAAWRVGDPVVTAQLAELELVRAGVARPRRRRR